MAVFADLSSTLHLALRCFLSQSVLTVRSPISNGTAVAMMIGAMGCFVINDAMVKHVSQSLPAAQLIFVRGLIASVMVFMVAHWLGALGQLRFLLQRRVLIRGVFDACATMLYLMSLFHLPIANATAINLAAPLFMTMFAVCFMGERAGWIRWIALIVGFTGVVLVVQPSQAGFNSWAMVCLAGTTLHAARDLMTRWIDPTVPSILITFSTVVAVSLLSGCLTLTGNWQTIVPENVALLAVAAAFLASGYFLIVQCLRAAEVSLTAPFRYTAVLFATLLGYLVWGEVPSLSAWVGVALLVGSGLYMLLSERAPYREALLEAQQD